MKTLRIRNVRGRAKNVIAKTTYQTASGKWIAEVDGEEFHEACTDLCKGIKDCSCENLHVEADQDDDGKEYSVLSK